MEDLTIGVVAGIVASLTFFVLLTMFRPRLKISPCIARTRTGDQDPDHRYRFKVVNRSFRSAVDVQIKAYIVRDRRVPKETEGETGIVRVKRQMDLKRSSNSAIPGFRPFSKHAPYAHRIRFHENISERLASENDQRDEIVVEVTARDGLTGFPRSFQRTYALHTQVKPGTFYFGRSLKIEPDPNQTPPVADRPSNSNPTDATLEPSPNTA